MGILLGKKKKKNPDLPTLFFSSPLCQYNIIIFPFLGAFLPYKVQLSIPIYNFIINLFNTKISFNLGANEKIFLGNMASD